MVRKTRSSLRLVSIALVAGFTGGGCTVHFQTQSQIPKVTSSAPELTIWLDTSGSTESIRKDLISQTYRLVASATKAGWLTKVFRFNTHVEQVYEGRPASALSFAQLLKKRLAGSPNEVNTDYPLLTENVLEEVAGSSRKQFVCVLGDGINDFRSEPGHMKRYRAVGVRLAKCANLERLIYWGIEPGGRDEVSKLIPIKDGRMSFLEVDQDPVKAIGL